MSKHFRPWKIDEAQLLPACVQDYVGKDHLARFVVALVRESLDLGRIVASYASSLGQPPYHAVMMVALLLYAYCCGIYSSDFRKRHLDALSGLFVQVLQLCRRA